MTESFVPTVHYTELPDLPPDHVLAQEWATYKRELPRLLAEGHEGRFVLVCKDTLFPPVEEAWQAQVPGWLLNETRPFLVHQIRAREPVDWRQRIGPGYEGPPPLARRVPMRTMPGIPVPHYSEIPDLPPDHVLAKEVRTFKREMPRLLAEGQEGRFALIKGDEVIGTWDDLWEAADAGRDKFGFAPFMVKQVAERERILAPTDVVTMPHYSFPTSPEGHELDVAVWLGATDHQACLAAGRPLPPLALRVRALIDTGSDITAVAPRLLQPLGIGPLISASTQTAGGKVGVHLYGVCLTILNPTVGAIPLATYPEWVVMELVHGPPQLDVLLGRDFAKLCLLILDGPRGCFTLGI